MTNHHLITAERSGDKLNPTPRKFVQKRVKSATARQHDCFIDVFRCAMSSGCFEILPNLCWVGRHIKYYHETDEPPNPRPASPTQPQEKLGQNVAFGQTFFPTQRILCRGLGLFYIGNTLQKKTTRPNSPQTPYFTGDHNNQDLLST